MTTSLVNCNTELSKQLGDYFASTTTGAGTTTTLIDTTLKAYQDDWINKWTWAFLTEEPASTATIYDERLATSLDSSSSELTTQAFSQAPGTGINYEIHRLFSPSEKRRALVYAARVAFPHLHEKIWDESMVSGNWLKDGSLEIWTSSSALTYWTKASSTITQTSTALYFKHGAYSCKLSTPAGNISQGIANWDDIKRLAGESVTFTAQGHCNTASCLRLSIYDGTTTTYSSYHPGTSAWTEEDDPLKVTATIADTPTEITFKVLHDVAAGTSYVDDARVISSSTNPRLYIANIGFAQEQPIQIFVEPSDYSKSEPWMLVHNAIVDTENGYLYLPHSVTNDRRLRLIGMGYLDFLVSGSSSTAWTAEINIDVPQTDILVAQAALYLYTEMSMPNFTAGDRKDFQEMIGFWVQELRKRINKFGMPIPSAPVKWR